MGEPLTTDTKPPDGPTEPRSIPLDAISRIQALYDAGRYLQAYDATQPFGSFRNWTDRAARVLAGRLTANLGAYKLSRVLHWLAWRSDKSNPDLAAYHAYTILHRRGPVSAFEFLEHFGDPPESFCADALVHFLTIRARVAAELRDFKLARQWLDRATALGRDHPWLATVRSYVLELQDRYAEALAAARHALELRPWYRPGVQALAHTLQLLDRDEEALAMLSEAAQHLESMHVVRQMATLQRELQLYGPAAESLGRFERLAP